MLLTDMKLAVTTLRDIFLSVCLTGHAFGASPVATSANEPTIDDWTIAEETSDPACQQSH